MITRDEAQLMDVLQGGRCFYCSEPAGAKATFDHVIPQAYGGADVAANIVLAHRRCNQMKGDRLPTPDEIDRFLAQRRGSRLGIWPPIAALKGIDDEDEAWMIVARAIADLPKGRPAE